MILEEDIAEEDENIVKDWYLDHSVYIMKKGVLELNFYVACFRQFYDPPSNKPFKKNKITSLVLKNIINIIKYNRKISLLLLLSTIDINHDSCLD